MTTIRIGNGLWNGTDACDFTGTKETYINSTVPDNNYGIYQSCQIQNSGGGIITQGLLSYPGLSNLSGVIVTAAEIHAFSGYTSVDNTISLRKLLVDWDEGTADGAVGFASWNNRKSGTSWNIAGAQGNGSDRVTTPSLTQAVSAVGGWNVFSGAGIIVDVQYFIDNPSSNFGWLFGLNADGRFDFTTTSWWNNVYWSFLLVTYTPAPTGKTVNGVLCSAVNGVSFSAMNGVA